MTLTKSSVQKDTPATAAEVVTGFFADQPDSFFRANKLVKSTETITTLTLAFLREAASAAKNRANFGTHCTPEEVACDSVAFFKSAAYENIRKKAARAAGTPEDRPSTSFSPFQTPRLFN